MENYKYVIENVLQVIYDDDNNYNLEIVPTYPKELEEDKINECVCGKKHLVHMSYIKNTNIDKTYVIGSRCIESMRNLIDFLQNGGTLQELDIINDNMVDIINHSYKIHFERMIRCVKCDKKILRRSFEAHKKTKTHIMNKRGDRLIDIRYEYRHIAKKAGAKWNQERKSWYIPKKLSDLEFYSEFNELKQDMIS